MSFPDFLREIFEFYCFVVFVIIIIIVVVFVVIIFVIIIIFVIVVFVIFVVVIVVFVIVLTTITYIFTISVNLRNQVRILLRRKIFLTLTLRSRSRFVRHYRLPLRQAELQSTPQSACAVYNVTAHLDNH